MNLGEIKTAVQRQFGDESGVQITEADITRWANDAQTDIVRKTEITNQHRETAVVSGDAGYELPANFMAMARVTYNNRVLPERELKDIDLSNTTSDAGGSGTPEAYYVWSNTLYLYPAPSTSGTGNLDIWYVSRPATLVNNADIPEIPVHMHEDIVRYCLSRAKELDEDYEASVLFRADYEDRILQARYEQTAQPVDTYPAVRALPDDEGNGPFYGWY